MKKSGNMRMGSVSYRIGYLVVDTMAMVAAYLLSVMVRFNFQEPLWGWRGVVLSFLVVWAVQLLALFLFGCYRLLWRFTSLADVPRFVGAVLGSALLFLSLRWFFPHVEWLRFPYTVTILNSFFLVAGLFSVRLLCRAALEGGGLWRSEEGKGRRVLLVGAGSAGSMALREIKRSWAQHPYFVQGFLDDDPAKLGASILGCRVLGEVGDLERIVRKYQIEQVIVTVSGKPRDLLRRVAKLGEKAGVPVLMLPEYSDLISGRVSVSRIRNIDVADLLGREEAEADSRDVISLLGRRRVMVTGAGGSIGSELVRQIVRCGPDSLLLVERSEYALYKIDREIRKLGLSMKVVPLIADVGDDGRMEAIFKTYSPQIVIHAAAHKHVPMMELNPGEAIKNNTLATRRLGELAVRMGVERFVLISTDKAVMPVSVMGISKRLAEIVLQDLNRLGKTRFSAVRFGNVLDSSGSVVPLFREQIRRGGPVTVTHPEMKRYFMTISEAVSLVLQATALADGGEIFVLDMGAPVKILELAEDMISLSGLRPYEDIGIEFTGIRPGEKLFEELDVSEKSAYKTGHARIFISKLGSVPEKRVGQILEAALGFTRGECGIDSLRTLLPAGGEDRAPISKEMP